MSIVRFIDPPPPPEDCPGGWCTICLMLAKNKIWQDHQKDIEAAASDGKGRGAEHWVPWDSTIKLFAGRYQAFSDLGVQMGLLNLCWTHVAGIRLQTMSPLAQADGPLPPGLIRGQG